MSDGDGSGVRVVDGVGVEVGVGVGVLTRGVTEAVGRGVPDDDLGVAETLGDGEGKEMRGVTVITGVTDGATVVPDLVPFCLAPLVSPRDTMLRGVTVGVTLSDTMLSPSMAGATVVPEPPVTTKPTA